MRHSIRSTLRRLSVLGCEPSLSHAMVDSVGGLRSSPEAAVNIFCARDAAADNCSWLWADRVLDWEKILSYAQLHGVLQFLAASLVRLGINPPRPWDAVLATRRERNTVRAILQHNACETIVRSLRESSVPVAPLKGTYLSKLLYGRVGDRISSDIDLLVPAGSLTRACGVLREIGYAEADSVSRLNFDDLLGTGNEMTFISPRGVIVELHWRLFEIDRCSRFPVDFENLRIAEGQIASEDLFLILALHALTHGWQTLKWVVDIDAFVRRVTLRWDDLFSRAEDTGTLRAVRIALLLAGLLLDTPLPEPISDPVARRLANRYARSLLVSAGNPPIVDFWLQMAARERWQDRWRFLRFVTQVKPWDLTAGRGTRWSRFFHLLRGSFRRTRLADVQRIPELRSATKDAATHRLT